ncbi:hypothetical protein MZO42_12620 [Sphingomonas psychrotolerans]|uniref:Uncharacterized protein n=1 Tax=Sphingomonas psychrotolerans TaxID=1327635 RepID=A0ABU3N6Z8_9SPHN|nr:hypothetical protein [Sphingomonas psychrotolerans]MDT8759542.1 hypothetical protein [Sphingomonas psychrotolerans]
MKGFFGAVLIAIGLLVAGLCGLCTGFFFLMFLGEGEPSSVILPLLLGGIPTLTGIGLFQWGRSLLRQAREDERPQ